MGMNINLTPQLEEMIRWKVDSGTYSSASEVVRDALRLMGRKRPAARREAGFPVATQDSRGVEQRPGHGLGSQGDQAQRAEEKSFQDTHRQSINAGHPKAPRAADDSIELWDYTADDNVLRADVFLVDATRNSIS